MQNTKTKLGRLSAILLSLVMSATMLTACNDDNSSSTQATTTTTSTVAITEPSDSETTTATSEEETTTTPDVTSSTEAPTEPQTTTTTPQTTLPTTTTTTATQSEVIYCDGNMRTNMTSQQFVKEMGVGINLGNTMEAFWEDLNNKTTGAQTIGANLPSNYETCWGAIVTTQKMIDGIRDAGFNTVRVPVYWGNMMADDGKFTINESYISRVEEIVNYCLNDGLYVVINIHHFDEFLVENYSEDDAVRIAGILWKQIAERFRDYSDYVIFEGYNEAMGTTRERDNYLESQKFTYVNRMNKMFVDTVRATGGNNSNRMLIVSGYWTNIDLTTKSSFVIPTDTVSDRIMISVHYVDNAMYWTNKIGGTEWWNYSVAQCELLKKAFTDKGYTVFIGECTGSYPTSNFSPNATTTSSSECLEKMLDLIVDYGFVPVLWDTNGGFYSRTACRINSASDAEVITRVASSIK